MIEVTLDKVSFQQEMRRVEQEVTQLANTSIEEKVDYAVDTLRVVTPVDTGEARRGWEVVKTKDKYGFQEASIENPVEHIIYLNRGHSRQAPKFFIEQVLITIGILTPN